MDRLEAMAIVLLAVEKGSLTAAAKTLNMPLPTISRKVSELEAHLGTKLLQRSTRALTLTDVGRVYVDSVRRVLADIEEIERTAAGEYTTARGELVVTAPFLLGQMYMVPLVADFLAAYPNVTVRLLLSDRNLHLLDDHVDMAVRLGPLPDSSMRATRVGATEVLVCAPPSLLETHGVPAHPQDLRQAPCVVFDGPATTVWSFREPRTRREFEVDIVPRFSVTSAEGAVAAALRCGAFTRVFRYHCSAALRAGQLVRVLQSFDVDPLPVHLIHPERGQLPLKTRVFLDFATDRLRAALAETD